MIRQETKRASCSECGRPVDPKHAYRVPHERAIECMYRCDDCHEQSIRHEIHDGLLKMSELETAKSRITEVMNPT